jgi:hypothetical protein
MDRTFLAIGWRLTHPQVREADFFEGPSLASVDAVFIDPAGLSDRWTHDVPLERDGVRRTYVESDQGFGRLLARVMAKRRSEAADLLVKRGGLIVCRLHPRGDPLEVVAQGNVIDRIDRFSWLPTTSLVDRQHQLAFPANTRFVPRRGSDVVLEGTGDPFERCLEGFEERMTYHAVYEDLLSTPVSRFARVLARNRVGDIVALCMPFEEGRLVLLPSVRDVSPAQEAAALVRAVSEYALRPAYTPVPDWLPGYPLPGEEAVRDELHGLRERRETLSLKIDEVEARLEEIARYGRMLYTGGRFALLPVVADAFRVLGFGVEEGRGDLVLRSDAGDAIGVVYATDRPAVDLTPYQRLLGAVDEARTSGEGPSKGILVVSASRGLDPRHRPTQFTPQVLRGCKSQGFCLLTTYDLFKLVRRALGAKGDKARADLRRGLLECDGEYRGSD